jgi:hypothetical protein
VKVWIVEQNAFQRALVQDEELRQKLYALGSQIKGHTTGRTSGTRTTESRDGKPLFLSCVEGSPDAGYTRRKTGGGLIDLPNPIGAPFVSALKEQLVTWQPKAIQEGPAHRLP